MVWRALSTAHVFLLVLFLVSSGFVSAQTQEKLVAELMPAPVGYSYSFAYPYPDYIIGFRDAGGHYYSYRAGIKDTGTLILVDSRPTINSIVYPNGAGELKVIELEDMYQVYGLKMPGTGKSLIIYGGGQIYFSRYDLYYGAVPPKADRKSVV